MRGIIIVGVILLAISIGMNVYLGYMYSVNREYIASEKAFEEYRTEYPLLSLRVLRQTHPDFILNFLDLRSKLHEKLDPLGDDFFMYFEYLPTGTNIGINSADNFFAASLFKLPIVMAYYRHKERENITEDIKVKLTAEMLDDRFGDLWRKGEGYEIGLEEASELALKKSDNTAAKALAPAVTQQDFDDVYEGLDVDLQLASEGAVMTTKNYSSILKALYFSAVLTHGDSQKILDFLTMSEFSDKLAAGVPKGVKVAHKIGVIDNQAYMDCGIVYIPSRPYILCMASKGTEAEARERMSTTSKLVYDYVSTAKSLIVDK